MLQIQSFVFSPIQENTYLLYNEQKECAIIDPGCYFEEEKQLLLDFITENDLQPVLLLNTHCHLDHVFGLKTLADRFSLVPHFHEKEEVVLQFSPTSGLMYNLPFHHYTGPFERIAGGNQLFLGSDEILVIDAPGHSPGSICFYCPKQHFIISGDVLFRQSVGRTDLPGGDTATLMESIRTALLVLPDETVVYSGHGPATTIGAEKMDNPYLSGWKS